MQTARKKGKHGKTVKKHSAPLMSIGIWKDLRFAVDYLFLFCVAWASRSSIYLLGTSRHNEDLNLSSAKSLRFRRISFFHLGTQLQAHQWMWWHWRTEPIVLESTQHPQGSRWLVLTKLPCLHLWSLGWMDLRAENSLTSSKSTNQLRKTQRKGRCWRRLESLTLQIQALQNLRPPLLPTPTDPKSVAGAWDPAWLCLWICYCPQGRTATLAGALLQYLQRSQGSFIIMAEDSQYGKKRNFMKFEASGKGWQRARWSYYRSAIVATLVGTIDPSEQSTPVCLGVHSVSQSFEWQPWIKQKAWQVFFYSLPASNCSSSLTKSREWKAGLSRRCWRYSFTRPRTREDKSGGIKSSLRQRTGPLCMWKNTTAHLQNWLVRRAARYE